MLFAITLLSAAVAEAAGAPVCSPLPPAPIGSATEDLARVLQLTGASPVRPLLFRSWSNLDGGDTCAGERAPPPNEVPHAPFDAFELQLLPLEFRNYLNTAYPDDRNDGALWEGRGLATALSGGVRVRWKFFSAAVAPLVAWQQNRDFFYPPMTLPGYSPYANPYNYGQIDLPLRFGPTSFWTVDPGQSYARVDIFNVAAGISTENLWWGPGVRNSILMTNSGPGFPHVFVGTSRPQDIWIGWLEVQFLWGRLTQSDYFTNESSRRLFSALTIGYEPRWIRGLFIGLARVFVDRLPSPLATTDYFFRFFWNGSGVHNGQENQLGSLFLRWVFPESGLEIYGELGRDDYSGTVSDFIMNPEHAQAYMMGMQKVFPLAGGKRIRFQAEFAHTLEKPTNNPTRTVPIFYTHGYEIQGYTQRGQMIGAGIGPQADSQFFALDLSHSGGRTGFWIERVLRNDRYFYDFASRFLGQDAEIAGGFRGVLRIRDVDVEWSLGAGYRYNLNFGNFGADTTSIKSMLSVSWTPPIDFHP